MSDPNQIEQILQRLSKLEALARRPRAEIPAFDQGVYTPTYGGLTTNGVTTYTTQQGNWRRIGDLMITQIELTWSNATGTGAAYVSLPTFAKAGMEFAMAMYPSGITFANAGVVALVNTGQNYFVMGSPLSNAATPTLAVETAGTIFGTAIYFTA